MTTLEFQSAAGDESLPVDLGQRDEPEPSAVDLPTSKAFFRWTRGESNS
ncbi:MAG: hypothetical protein QOF16_1636 [Actinomycetota bacterium]|nr:hypothetical protein [Actinomycetota bacterium]MEA2487982.1 hypothetical protein [Actinomycetota bacterium]